MKGSAPKVHIHSSDMTSLNSRLQLALINRKKGRNALEKGFTLVELMIVIVIVGILSAVALPNFLSQTEKAKATEAKTKISSYLKQGHAEWQEQGQVTDTETETDADTAGRFAYEGTLTAGDATATPPTPSVWSVVATAHTSSTTPGYDQSIAGKKIYGCVNLETGVTKTSPQLTTAATANVSCN